MQPDHRVSLIISRLLGSRLKVLPSRRTTFQTFKGPRFPGLRIIPRRDPLSSNLRDERMMGGSLTPIRSPTFIPDLLQEVSVYPSDLPTVQYLDQCSVGWGENGE
jgi:hypothetical protein